MLKKVCLVPFLTIIVIVFVGCEPSGAGNIESRLTESPFPDENPTEIRSATLSPTRTRYPTTTATTLPTLTDTERRAYITELLQTNAGCNLPCWWGIVPGDSIAEDVESLLSFMGATYRDGRVSEGIAIGGLDFTRESFSNGVDFYKDDNDKIKHIIINAAGFNPDYSREFMELWRGYSPEQIINTYGQPSRVLFYGDPAVGEEFAALYSLWLFYDEAGIGVYYKGRILKQPINQMCPTFGSGGDLLPRVNLYLKNMDDPTPLDELTTLSFLAQSTIFPIEELGVSIESFYDAYLQENDGICFEIPVVQWP